MHPFECSLSVSAEDISLTLAAFGDQSWLDFWLNPRRLRGSDFLMRWEQGQWSEERLTEAVNATDEYFALPYGPSSVAPSDDVRKFELYFEELEAAGLGTIKKPDLLILDAKDKGCADECIEQLGGVVRLPFTSEDDPRLRALLDLAKLAIECENSLWRASHMPDYGKSLSPQRRLGGKPGLKKTAVLPTVIVKEEDRGPLRIWQKNNKVPLHIWHVFYDRAYGLGFDESERLIADGMTAPVTQVFQAPGGATTHKTIYKHYYHHAYPLAEAVSEPRLLPACIEDKNGHILPYVRFDGGSLQLTQEAMKVLESSQ